MTLRDEAVAVADDLVELRHALHAEPEIGYELPKTQRKVLGALEGLPLEISTGDKLSSVTAVLRGGRPGPVVLLRGDMDALPIHEATGVPFTSRIDGVMHACGHDLHTTMLAGAARLLSARQADLPGTVIFMFQPAEEGGGGAKMMIDEGVLDAAGARPVAAYALHVFSGLLDHGVFATRSGPILAGSDAIDVTVRGRGGHGSAPHSCVDPIPAACEMVTALHAMVTRRFDVFDPVVVTVGSIHGGTARNVIPDEVTFLVTARSFSPGSKAKLRENMVRLLENIALAHGVTVEIDYADGYPVTANDAGRAAFAASTAADLFGTDRAFDIPNPLTGSEDFSFVLQQVPGAFVLLGACPPGTDVNNAPGNHSALATFDDGVLVDGTTLYAELAVRSLAG
ncbi:MAG TPA: M20 family metallopeptidase [Streptosporangiaceae bacterium]|nr:M20 family metallopeptidase [Streptosporangiaceae bacterium]